MERHLEKNAGSTFREVIMHAERRGKCMYWGFQQRSPAWQAAIAALRNLTAQDIPPRLCIEAHSGIDYGVPWLERFAQLRGLRKVFAERGIDIPLHFHVRFRSPLSHYVSYYLWTVVERQTRNAKKFGSSFADWARSVPNLQSELFLSSKAAFTASFAPKDHKEIKEWRQRWAVPAKAAARRRLVWELLNEYDLLGTTDQFEESSLVVARALNWSVHDMAAPDHLLKQTPNAGDSCASARAAARSAVKRHWLGKPWPWWCRNPTLDYNAEKARVHSRVCPNRTACEELIREVVPLSPLSLLSPLSPLSASLSHLPKAPAARLAPAPLSLAPAPLSTAPAPPPPARWRPSTTSCTLTRGGGCAAPSRPRAPPSPHSSARCARRAGQLALNALRVAGALNDLWADCPETARGTAAGRSSRWRPTSPSRARASAATSASWRSCGRNTCRGVRSHA